MIVLFISPGKTAPLGEDGVPVQKLRHNVSVPAMTILGSLRAAGFETSFLDLSSECWENQSIVGDGLVAYGLPDDSIMDQLAVMRPDFVLISSMFSVDQMLVDDLVRVVKKSSPQVIVILGGVHASIRPEWHFQGSYPDFVVLGEGEITIVELLTELSRPNPDPSRVQGIAYTGSSGSVQFTEPRPLLKELDRPYAYDQVLLLPDGTPRYLDAECRKHPIYVSEAIGEDVPAFIMCASRGCPRSCKYCTATRRAGNRIRHMGAYHLFSQFLTVRKRFGAAIFCNQSDTFAAHPADIEFLRMVADYRQSSGDQLFALNNPNGFFLEQFFLRNQVSHLDLDMIDLFYRAGFNAVSLAVETLNQRFNDKADWNRIHPARIVDLCHEFRSRGINTDIYMMYGFPGQTYDEFRKDLDFAEQVLPAADLVTWNFLSLLPGSRYYDEHVVARGKESAYREMIRQGFNFYRPSDEFNLCEVSVRRLQEAVSPFGKAME